MVNTSEDLASPGGEAYESVVDNAFTSVGRCPLSTFSIDVDTASYSNIRRFLNEGQLPPRDAVRIEELVNYFPYRYPDPDNEQPLAVAAEVADCPWQPGHRLVRIGLQGKRISREDLPPRNLVFLIDVSGSMDQPNKLPLVKKAISLLVEQLGPADRVAMVTYAGEAGLKLPATPGSQKKKILDAVESLKAGGSTNGAGGIQLAYKIARQNLIDRGINRVILATDGDFNVGVTDQKDLVKLIEGQRKSGVFLTVLGFGMGNLKDATLEKLAHHGNGHYGYVDSLSEAHKVFGEQGGALVTVAKDVKIQVEFNPKKVQRYRLIGYENRLLRDRDFNNDKKDAGDMGSGHTVTALYEIVPVGLKDDEGVVDPLRYQERLPAAPEALSGELLTVKVRYKEPDGEASRLLSTPVQDAKRQVSETSGDFRFAAAVVEFGLLLRDSPHKGKATYATARKLARQAVGPDPDGYRGEFLKLLDRAESLAKKQSPDKTASRGNE
jgi:Ca-activated chloride channel family protein